MLVKCNPFVLILIYKQNTNICEEPHHIIYTEQEVHT